MYFWSKASGSGSLWGRFLEAILIPPAFTEGEMGVGMRAGETPAYTVHLAVIRYIDNSPG